MSTLAHLIGFGMTIAGFMVMGDVIPPPPQWVINATPYFVCALMVEAAYPSKSKSE